MLISLNKWKRLRIRQEKLMVKNACIEITYVAENKEENYLEIYTFQLSLPLLNIPNCQSVFKFLSPYCKLLIFAWQLYVQIRVHELLLC